MEPLAGFDVAERLEVERRVQTLVVSVGKGLEQSEKGFEQSEKR